MYMTKSLRLLTSISTVHQLVVAVGLGLNVANLIGYVKCKKDAGKKIKSLAGNFLGRQLLNQVLILFAFVLQFLFLMF